MKLLYIAADRSNRDFFLPESVTYPFKSQKCIFHFKNNSIN